MGDICYGHTCLVVFMNTHRNILINTERKGGKTHTRTTTKDMPHLKREREVKRVREGVVVERCGCWWMSYFVNTVYSCP